MNNADDLLEAYFKGLREGKPKWIPVTERLPDFEGCLLCMVEDGIYGIRHQAILYFDERGFTEGFEANMDLNVTHWMPLPEPPREG